MGQPQLGDEAGEADEQRGVEQALRTGTGACPQPRTPRSRNADHEHARVRRRAGQRRSPGRPGPTSRRRSATSTRRDQTPSGCDAGPTAQQSPARSERASAGQVLGRGDLVRSPCLLGSSPPGARPAPSLVESVLVVSGPAASTAANHPSPEPGAACLIRTSFGDDEAHSEAITAGASDYVLEQSRSGGAAGGGPAGNGRPVPPRPCYHRVGARRVMSPRPHHRSAVHEDHRHGHRGEGLWALTRWAGEAPSMTPYGPREPRPRLHRPGRGGAGAGTSPRSSGLASRGSPLASSPSPTPANGPTAQPCRQRVHRSDRECPLMRALLVFSARVPHRCIPRRRSAAAARSSQCPSWSTPRGRARRLRPRPACCSSDRPRPGRHGCAPSCRPCPSGHRRLVRHCRDRGFDCGNGAESAARPRRPAGFFIARMRKAG